MNQPMSGANYVQALVTRTPKFDNEVKKHRPAATKRKKKKGERDE